MVVVPSGRFLMGSPAGERGRYDKEGPIQEIAIPKMLAVGRYSITRDEFMAFVAATNYPYGQTCQAEVDNRFLDRPNTSFLSPPGFSPQGRDPIICVSWNDAKEYTKWLSAKTGKAYRLLSEAEREYVTRAGSATPYWWGETVSPSQANYDTRQRSYSSGKRADLRKTAGRADHARTAARQAAPRRELSAEPLGTVQRARQRRRVGRGLLEPGPQGRPGRRHARSDRRLQSPRFERRGVELLAQGYPCRLPRSRQGE